MAVPKRRTSKTSRNQRRSHHAVKRLQLTTCPRCQQAVPAHMTCPNCGTYQNRQVIDVVSRLNKKERRAKEKSEHTH